MTDLRSTATALGTVAYREAGAAGATPLVLLHGVGSGSASWEFQLEALPARGIRVLAWDAPGYGGSEPLGMASPVAADYAAALLAFADAMKLGRFHLIGHSMGALVAASFAASHGRRLEALVLGSPAIGYATADAATRRARVDGRLSDMAALGPAGLALKRAQMLLSPDASAEAVAHVRAVMSGLKPAGYAQAVRMLGAADTLADGARITTPTLVLCGNADEVTPEAQCRRVAAAIPGAAFESLPGLGHACYIENPAAFNAAVLRFFEGRRG